MNHAQDPDPVPSPNRLQQDNTGSICRVGLLGLGTVGAEVARMLEDGSFMRRRTGNNVEVCGVLIRDQQSPRAYTPSAPTTTDPSTVLDDPDSQVIIELIGGETPAHEFIRRAIANGKHVITANKEVMARHGPELLKLAEGNGVTISFEAAVGGGTPIIASLLALQANEILSIEAVVNGTTNYILDSVADGKSPSEAMAEARSLGYAEANPSSDVDGYDAVYKLCIMSAIAFNFRCNPGDIYREGITGLDARDIACARNLGYVIRLLAQAHKYGNEIDLRVHPTLLPREHPLAHVNMHNNGFLINGNPMGQIVLTGPGAGGTSTASAVVGDLIRLANSVRAGLNFGSPMKFDNTLQLLPMANIQGSAFFCLDAGGSQAITEVKNICRQEAITISSVTPMEANDAIAVVTGPAPEHSLQLTWQRLRSLHGVHLASSFIRML